MSIIISLGESLTVELADASLLQSLRCEESPLGFPLYVKLGTYLLGFISAIFHSPPLVFAFAASQ